MTAPSEDRLIHDWAVVDGEDATTRPRPMLDDETLRDGLQSPSVTDPPVGIKIEVLHLMNRLGIETADIGLPGAGPRQRDAVERLCREIDREHLRIRANCAARTMVVDIQPIAD
ncbi:MAG: 2-isopropylmalate synthase, partial [Gemmatimonadota bacterium]